MTVGDANKKNLVSGPSAIVIVRLLFSPLDNYLNEMEFRNGNVEVGPCLGHHLQQLVQGLNTLEKSRICENCGRLCVVDDLVMVFNSHHPRIHVTITSRMNWIERARPESSS